MTIALRYSTLPYPNGCFLSASFPASFVPTMVMRELAASERLFTASITMAIEFEANPTKALNAARKTLAMIPIILVFTIVLSRLCIVLTSYLYSNTFGVKPEGNYTKPDTVSIIYTSI